MDLTKLGELGITQILAHSPEAKGRVERANGTFQALPTGVRTACQRVATRCGVRCPAWKVADRLVVEMDPEVLGELCLATGDHLFNVEVKVAESASELVNLFGMDSHGGLIL